MFTKRQNALLNETRKETPLGEVMRRYWIPALMSEEIPEPDCPPVRVPILGEELVAFRDTDGRIGVVAEHCSHRGTSLFYGRNENCGLRCGYHGWKMDELINTYVRLGTICSIVIGLFYWRGCLFARKQIQLAGASTPEQSE